MKEQLCGLGNDSGLIARDKKGHFGEMKNNNPYNTIFL
jgi:hypothetical protein